RNKILPSLNRLDSYLSIINGCLLARIRRCPELIVGCGIARSNNRSQERHHSCDMLVHMVMTDMKLLVVETETADITADDVDTVFCSTDVGRSKQLDQNFVHSSIEPHFHDIHVDRDKHEVDRR
nr:hypothetical protein [Tanacetum cinerariifolium]